MKQLSNALETKCNEVVDLFMNGVYSEEQAIVKTAEILGTNPTFDLWEQVFESMHKTFVKAKKVTEGTATNNLTKIKKQLKEKFEIVKPQTAKAKKQAEQKAERDATVEHLSNDEIATAMVSSVGNKTRLDTLARVLRNRNKANEKQENQNAKELINKGIKEIKEWITLDANTETQISRVEKVLAFIHQN